MFILKHPIVFLIMKLGYLYIHLRHRLMVRLMGLTHGEIMDIPKTEQAWKDLIC